MKKFSPVERGAANYGAATESLLGGKADHGHISCRRVEATRCPETTAAENKGTAD